MAHEGEIPSVGAAIDDGYGLPLTQEELADVLGLTAVHVNRTLQGLRNDGLIRLRDHRLDIPNTAALPRVGGFGPAYLHLGDAAKPRAPRPRSAMRCAATAPSFSAPSASCNAASRLLNRLASPSGN